jgi:hypothetical protein
MTAAFLALLDSDPVFTFQTFDDDKERKSPALARVFHGTLEQHARALTRRQQDGAGVFFMVNKGDGVIHKGNKTCRTTANVLSVRSLFLDLDGTSPHKVFALERRPIIVQSSPGRWHAYWPVTDLPLEGFDVLQRKLAHAFDGDPSVHDLPRVMRLPGFWHQKGEPFMTHVVD